MKYRKFETPFYAVAGLVTMFVLLVALNVIVSQISYRADLTQEQAFSLNEGTKRILASLKSPVQVRFYMTQSGDAMPLGLKNYAQNVNDVLGAMVRASHGKLQVQRFDPLPDSDAEDSARLDGVDAQTFPNGEKIYLGLSFTHLDNKSAIPFLAPDREQLLEYDIARAIKAVTDPTKPLIGLLTPLPTSMPPQMMQMMERPPSPGVFFDELRRTFEVRELPFASEEIPADIKTLLVVHPKMITEQTQYAIDQFVLGGGRLVAFLDPLCVMDIPPGGPMMASGPPSASTLSWLLPAWGVKFSFPNVVVDMRNIGNTRRGRAPGILAFDSDAIARNNVVTGGLDSLLMALAGSYAVEPREGIESTWLVRSSKDSEISSSELVQSSPQVVEQKFKPSGEEYNMALKLEGRFKTAFPKGKPEFLPEAVNTAPDAKDLAATPKAGGSGEKGLTESVEPTTIYLVGDADMLFDPLAVREMMTPFGRPVLMPANGNIDMAQTMVEQLAGGDDLAAVRSRASRNRPFTVVQRMQAEAESKYRDKISELERGLTATQGRLAELEQTKDAGQQFIFTPEQQEEIKAFREKEAASKRELKEVRRTLRYEVESLEQWIKWINILAMPVFVALVGLLIAYYRHRRHGAR